MVIRPKAVRWGVPWSAVEDSKLLVGLYEHGMGNWLDIKQNKPLGLQDKVRFLVSNYHCVKDNGSARFFQVINRRSLRLKTYKQEWNTC